MKHVGMIWDIVAQLVINMEYGIWNATVIIFMTHINLCCVNVKLTPDLDVKKQIKKQ